MEHEKNLHPSVQEFKHFLQQHPSLIKAVREDQRSLQSVYEDWIKLGEDHDNWFQYKKADHVQPSVRNETSQKSGGETLSQIMTLVKQMDLNEMQSLLGQFSSVLGNIQNVMQTFQQPPTQQKQKQEDFPFSFRRD